MTASKSLPRHKPKVIFFGTPDFAVGTLQKILEAGYEVVGVVTAPDKPAGRGRKMKESEVKKFAKEHGLLVLQPVSLKSSEFLEQLRALKPDVGVVVAFRILPESVYTIPPLGTFNIHASLLPDYRGAAPIHHAIINGEKETGVTSFFINQKVDTGEMILQQSVPISEEETFGSLHDKLKEAGAELAVQTLDLIGRGEVKTIPQDPRKAIHKAPKLTSENTRIQWNKKGSDIYNFIRGLSPVPGAWTYYTTDGKNLKRMKIYQSTFQPEKHNFPVGSTLVYDKTFRIAVPDGFIIPLKIKPENKKEMSNNAFLNGLQNPKKLIFK